MKALILLEVSCGYMRRTESSLSIDESYPMEVPNTNPLIHNFLQNRNVDGLEGSSLVWIIRYEVALLNHIFNCILLKPNHFLPQ